MKTTPIKQGLSKLFAKNEKSEELANVLIEKSLLDGVKTPSDDIGFIDETSVFMIHPKNETMKALIKNNFNINGNEKKIPKLDFKVDEKDKEKEIASKFSMNYLKTIMKICDGYEWVQIKMKRNYPISIETDDFKCLLAPRFEPADE
jgi:hypothetical protein